MNREEKTSGRRGTAAGRYKGTDDLELARSFQDNTKESDASRQAFDELVMRYQDRIFNLCYRFLGDYDEANDCAQETFIKMYRGLDKFQFKSSFFTWLYRIAVNTCKNRLASREFKMKWNPLHRENREEYKDTYAAVNISDKKHNPQVLYEKKEKEEHVQRAIDGLPGLQKTLVILRDIEGKAYEEIAEITGLKLGTVKSRLTRARHLLREKLKGIVFNGLQ